MAVPEEIQEQVLKEATSATPNFSVDMNSQQFKDVDKSINDSWNDYNQTVGGMIDDVGGYYQGVSDKLQEQADSLVQTQKENTDFIIEKIEQQKDQAHKDYLKEQSGAYVDWRKQSNQYGTEAEKMASAGLANTGYSESSQVSMYNTYQNRVAVARESLNQTILNYNNNIKEAQLQNNATVAQIYSDLALKQAELALEGFQYKNQLVQDLANKKIEFENTKWNRYQDILNQINTENAMKWDVTKYYDEKAWKTEEAKLDREFQAKRDELNRQFEAEQAELNRKHAIELENVKDKHEKEQLKIQHDNEMAQLKKQQEYKLAQIDKELAAQKELKKYENDLNRTQITGSTSGYSSAYQSGTKKSNTSNKTSSAPIYNPTNSGVKNALDSAGKNNSIPTDYSGAVSHMKKLGVPASRASAMMTMGEWSRRRTSYSMTGQGSAEVKNNSTYAEYVQDYVQYAVSNYGFGKS